MTVKRLPVFPGLGLLGGTRRTRRTRTRGSDQDQDQRDRAGCESASGRSSCLRSSMSTPRSNKTLIITDGESCLLLLLLFVGHNKTHT